MTYNRIIYRVQDDEGRGPFKPGFTRDWFTPRSDKETEKLLAPLDRLNDVRKYCALQSEKGYHIAFGCHSPKQLRIWFTESDYLTLLKHGYHAVKVPHCAVMKMNALHLLSVRKDPFHYDAKRFNLWGVKI